MKLEEIGFYTLTNQRARTTSIFSPLQRCELLLTPTCNFKCKYCRGIRNDYEKTLTFFEAFSILNYWIHHNLKNIRFSGGEPTLWEGLVPLVEYAKSCNVNHIAISTNGSSNWETYETLIKAGINDFSISLDACCSSIADKISGTTGLWNNVIENIKKIVAKGIYVTIGIVLTEENVNDIENIIKFAHNLGVSDIRIIPSAQYNQINKFNIDKNILNKYPILKYRVNNFVNNIPFRGLMKNDCHQCFLVLDDMAVAGNYHFPCIIWLREQGNPIGEIKSSTDMRKERFNWMINTDIHKQSICKNNCLDVCRDYNNTFKKINNSWR